MRPIIHRLLAAWLVLLAAASLSVLILRWPESATVATQAERDSLRTIVTRIATIHDVAAPDSADRLVKRLLAAAPRDTVRHKRCPRSDSVFFLIALLCGVLGGATHGLSSLMDFRGQRRLFRSWSLWYFGLPLLGGMLATIMLLVLRAGLFPNREAVEALNPFAVGAVGALAGLFTDKATSKLADVLETLFATEKKREGPLTPTTSTPATSTPAASAPTTSTPTPPATPPAPPTPK